MKYLFYILILFAAFACGQGAKNEEARTVPNEIISDSAQWVVQQAIARHGGALIDNSAVTFTFRNRAYKAQRSGQQFSYQRNYATDSDEKIADTLTNSRFTRHQNGQIMALSAKDSLTYASSLNSVMYFAFLPYFLTDPAVQLSYQGITNAFGEPHYELLVRFAENGGGEDFEDEYAYWIHTTNFTLDYLAYNFQVNGGGARFRQAFNRQDVKGIVFQDYINFKPRDDSRQILSFDSLFLVGGMDTLSLIQLEELRVLE